MAEQVQEEFIEEAMRDKCCAKCGILKNVPAFVDMINKFIIFIKMN